MVLTTKRPATFDELWAVPDGMKGEIVAGELIVSPRPGPPHLEAEGHLFGELYNPFHRGRGGPGGWAILVEPYIRFGDQIRSPDLAGWKLDRFPRISKGPYEVLPDWICELLSPRSRVTDRSEKMPLYGEHGVGHAWLVDPVGRSLEVYRRTEAGWLLVGTHAGDAKVRAEPFDAIELDLSFVWGFAPPPVLDEE